MSSLSNWIAMGAHAALAPTVGLLLRPVRGSFEQDLACGLTSLGYLANVVRFLAEALHFGRWPAAPAAYATNWVRYTGAGLGTAFFIGALASLSRGGVLQFIFTVLSVLVYYAALTFASLAFQTNAAVIGFYTLAIIIFVGAVLTFFFQSTAKRSMQMWVPAVTWLLEIGFLAMAGIELFKRRTASNAVEDWVFASISIAKGVWALIVYVGNVRETWIGQIATSEEVTSYVVAERDV